MNKRRRITITPEFPELPKVLLRLVLAWLPVSDLVATFRVVNWKCHHLALDPFVVGSIRELHRAPPKDFLPSTGPKALRVLRFDRVPTQAEVDSLSEVAPNLEELHFHPDPGNNAYLWKFLFDSLTQLQKLKHVSLPGKLEESNDYYTLDLPRLPSVDSAEIAIGSGNHGWTHLAHLTLRGAKSIESYMFEKHATSTLPKMTNLKTLRLDFSATKYWCDRRLSLTILQLPPSVEEVTVIRAQLDTLAAIDFVQKGVPAGFRTLRLIGVRTKQCDFSEFPYTSGNSSVVR